MSWLLRDDEVLAALEDRRPGWRASCQGAVLLRGPTLVQTVTPSPSRPLDVAWWAPAALDGGRDGLQVRRIKVLERRRVSPPRLGAGGVLLAPAGTFERWRLRVGDCLEIKGP